MEIHWYQLLFQIINFGILIFVLKKFLYQPIINVIEQRNKKIQDSIKAAEETLKEKTKIEAIKKTAIQEAEKETVKIIKQAHKKANISSKEIIETAREQADQEVAKKLTLLTGKLNQQEAQITSRITDLVIKATSRVLKESLSIKEQKSIIDSQVKKLAELK